MTVERRDLNLFRVFEAVVKHRNVTAASRELGLTASAVSHALNRLRALLGDDLFLLTVRGMQPTLRAIELAPRVAAALSELNDVMVSKAFLPAKAERVFRIGASDYSAAIILPSLVQRILEQAPKVRLRLLPIGRVDLVEQLDEGRIDMVVSWFGLIPHRIRRKKLVDEQETLVVRKGHPLASRDPNMSDLLSHPHLVVELTGDDDLHNSGFLDERGLHRRVWIERLLLNNVRPDDILRLTSLTLPNYGPVASMLRGTNLVATVPLRWALQMVQSGEAVILKLPFEALHVEIEAAWHERSERDLALQCLINELVSTCAEC